jgi:WD40 repeat protein/serine/threonine protein kinase
MMEDLSGRIIKGYELRKLIGEGGFGAVYLAQQRLIGREVAVKIILPQYANQPDFIRRFETEAQLVARLEHPHIVPLYDYWREPGGAYLVMRYLRGGSLHQSLKQSGPWKPAQIAEMLTQIAAALTIAHRQGVIHRDLKPENILLDENENAYLSDFGIAKDLGRLESITQNNAIVGSPAYISPEQIKGEPLTQQTDIYMLGILLYEALTGSHPYPDATSASLLYKHLSEPIPDLFKINPEIPLALNTVIQRATAKDTNARYKDVLELASDFRRALRAERLLTESDERAITSGTLTLPEPENPYKGLRAFQQADAADFFGRDSLTAKLVERLKESSTFSRFLAVVGPSGSGKSSVVKAGLIPALQKGAIAGSDRWFMVEMVPGIDPMEELEATLLRVAVNPPDSLLHQLNEDERGFVRAVKRVLPGDDSELLLFIDQFEELFTLVDEEEKRIHLMDSLIAAVTDMRSRIRVVLTLRADFYDRPLNYVRFGELMQQRTEIVLPLTTDEIEAAVSRPADRAGLQLERGLVTTIVADVKEQPGALPLLQYALTELYERREGRALTLSAYNDIGGTMGALARRADELYAGLGKDGQEAARQIFLRLVTLGEGTEDTRRRVFQSELVSIGKDRDTLEMVLDAFGRYRLLTFDNDPQTRQSTVEVAHEALIRQWGRLRDWLSASREGLRLQRRVSSAAQDWQEAGHDQSFLARGSYLDQLETWFENTDLAMTETEREYIHASIALRERQRAEEAERQRREEELEKRSRDRLRALVAVLAAALVVALILSGIAVTQSQAAQAAQQQALIEADNAATQAAIAHQNADEARALALAANARNALSEHNPMLAVALGIEASEIISPPDVEVVRVLSSAVYAPGIRHRFDAPTASVMGVAYSPDGRTIASASADGSLRVWDAIAGALNWQVEIDGIVTSAAFSPSGSTIVSSGTDNVVRLWDVTSGELLQKFEGHTDIVTDVAFSPDGDFILSGSLDRTLILWDVDTGKIIRQFDESGDPENPLGGVTVVAFSLDGTKVLAGTVDETIANTPDDFVDRTVRVWDVESGDQLQKFVPQSGFIRAASFSPDGNSVVVGTWDGANDGTLRIYSIETGEETRRIYAHSDIVSGVAYSPDGKYLMSSSWDNTLRLWDAATGVELRRFTGFGERLLGFAFSGNGEYVVAGTGNLGNNEIQKDRERARDKSVWVIDMKNRAEIRSLSGHQDWVWEIDLSADGKLIASGAGPLRPPVKDSTVHLWNAQTGESLHILEGHTDTVDGVAFTDDGARLLSGSWDGTLILWDVKTGEKIRRFEGHEGRITSVDVRGTRAISGDHLGNVLLWDLETGQQIRAFNPIFSEDTPDDQKEVGSVAFNQDGTQALAAYEDRLIRLFDVETGEEIRRFEGHTGQVTTAVFSPDEQLIASSSWDTSIRLWSVETGEQIRQYMGHSGAVLGVAFSPDGQTLFSGGADEVIRMWDAASGEELRRFNGHTNWISSIQLLPDGRTMVSGAQDNTVKLWRVDRSVDDLLSWTQENRYIRPLTCDEQRQYRIEGECD